MPDFEARCQLLERENEELRLKVEQLQEQLGMTFNAPPFFELSGSEAILFGVLMHRQLMTTRLGMDALYGNKPADDEAEEKIVDVFVCKMRAKLEAWEVKVETAWGRGYYMTPEMKARVQALIAERAGS